MAIINKPPQIVAPGCVINDDCGVPIPTSIDSNAVLGCPIINTEGVVVAVTDEITTPIIPSEYFAECNMTPPALLYDGTARGDGVFFFEGVLQ